MGFITSLNRYFKTLVRLNLCLPTRYPLLLYLELTKRCNLKCGFCDIWRTNTNKKEELKLNHFISLFDEAKKNKVQFITIGGGEPLLRKDIYRIVEALSDRNLATSFTTNGTLIDKNAAKKLASAGLKRITLSLDAPLADVHDGLRGSKGAFDSAVAGIRHLKKESPSIKININMVLNKKNYSLLSQMVDLAENLDVSVLNILPVHKAYPQSLCNKQDAWLFFDGKEDFKNLKREVAKFKGRLKNSSVISMSEQYLHSIPYQHINQKFHHRCFAGNLFCEIDAFGRVFPCYGCTESIGNIKNQGLASIWHSKDAEKMRKKLKNCSSCFQNCYAEPSLRFSPRFLMGNPVQMLKEYIRLLN